MQGDCKMSVVEIMTWIGGIGACVTILGRVLLSVLDSKSQKKFLHVKTALNWLIAIFVGMLVIVGICLLIR